MGGKGGTTINQPPPIDPGKAMGDYLFGKGFKNYRGVTDPRLQERLIAAEEAYRPRYASLELQDINTFAFGEGGGKGSDAYRAKEIELEGLRKARKAYGKDVGTTDINKIVEAQIGKPPNKKDYNFRFGSSSLYERDLKKYKERKAILKRQVKTSSAKDYDARIAIAEADLKRIGEGKGRMGLFGMLEESGRRASKMQRESLAAQREDDVEALREYAPQVVQAYRDADPYSTELAEQTQRRAMGRLTPDEEREIQQQARASAEARGRTGAVADFGEVLARRQFTDQYTQPAFQMNRALAGDVGMTILGRPSSGLALGGAMLGQAQNQAAGPMGPQLFDPNMGINMAMQQRSQDMNLLGAQAQANATASAGVAQMIGGILCWVAREVYGVENPRWLAFRQWMFVESPSWLFNLYLKHGERFAKFISNKPFIKKLIRKWMDTKIS